MANSPDDIKSISFPDIEPPSLANGISYAQDHERKLTKKINFSAESAFFSGQLAFITYTLLFQKFQFMN
jgi:ferritin